MIEMPFNNQKLKLQICPYCSVNVSLLYIQYITYNANMKRIDSKKGFEVF